MNRTTGDPRLDALIAFGAVLLVMGVLVLLAVPFETTDAGRRWAIRLLELVFPPRDYER